MGNSNPSCCSSFKSYFKSTEVNVEFPDEVLIKINSIIRIQRHWRRYRRKLARIKSSKEKDSAQLEKASTKRSYKVLKSSKNDSIAQIEAESKSKEKAEAFFNDITYVKYSKVQELNEVEDNLNSILSEDKKEENASFNMFAIPGIIINSNRIKESTHINIVERENSLEKYTIDDRDLKFFAKNQNKIKKFTIEYPDKSLYSGTLNGKWEKHGFGVFILLDKSKYIGFFKNNMFHGKGRLIDIKGDYFEGYFKQDCAHGFGKHVSSTGEIYIGFWANDKHQGKGQEFFKDGSQYEGEFKNGMKEGKGKFVYPDGSSYEGDFLNDQMHGKGIYKLGEGKIYHGDFFKGKMEGTGFFIWPDKKKYIGQYQKDKKQGYGIFIWPEGKRYEGEWKAGKQHGYGLYISNGLKKYGYWENGIKQNWVDEAQCLEVIKKIQLLKLNDIQSVSNLSRSSNTSI